MHIDTYFFVVWAHRSAKSIFGPASNPVRLNGGLLCFKTEAKARAERDRLNARSGSSHVRYSVRPVRVHPDLPGGVAKEASAAPQHPMSSPDASHAAAPRAA